MHQLAKKNGFKFLSKEYKGCEVSHKWKCQNGHTWDARPTNIKSGKGCPKCKHPITEDKCRFAIEELTGKIFYKNKTILNNLELDGYCEELNLAFEYNGEQHYHFIKYWHKKKNNFQNQIERDIKKKQLCQKKEINLIVIPYTVSKKNKLIEKFILKSLKEFNINVMNEEVDWKKYKRTSNKLEDFLSLCEKRKIICLSKYYPSYNEKIYFKCNVCNNVWDTRIKCIKRGHGCPKCGNIQSQKIKKNKRSKFDDDWDKHFKNLCKFIQKNDRLPKKRENKLGIWIVHQRSRLKLGKLKKERIKLLSSKNLI